MSTLDLGLIGNGSISALIDPKGDIVWSCLPRFDSNPAFCSLLREGKDLEDFGFFSIELENMNESDSEQFYLENTAILITRLYDRNGGGVEITDFCPRFYRYGRTFRPIMMIRRVTRLSGNPRLRVRLRPSGAYGKEKIQHTLGSNHIRYLLPNMVLRLTTDASVTAIAEELPFFLEDSLSLLLGPDETLPDAPNQVSRRFLEDTTSYWLEWVRSLAIPFEWQEAVIRAAITLKLNTYDETGAIIAAVTTSIPEAANTVRNWDYRYCWLRDGYFVVNALNRLGATKTMERYLAYIINIAAASNGDHLQPVYGIDGRADLTEQTMPDLPGYRGMGPVRCGNQAYEQIQHDVYGSAVLAVTHVFFDERLGRRGNEELFHRLEGVGEMALRSYDQPDAGLWELRGTTRVHTFSALMCWAACDRLARIANRLNLSQKISHWREAADKVHARIMKEAWSEKRNSFVSTFDGEELDASLLLLAELGFINAEDPRFIGTVSAIEKELKFGDFIFRYVEPDDFGRPENAFLVCSFWYVNALASIGRRDEARTLFEKLLCLRNSHGLLSEHVNIETGELWGNYVQTYSMVGLINSAIRLSIRWDQAF